jgi:archaetidylinositol phosphate synthase
MTTSRLPTPNNSDPNPSTLYQRSLKARARHEFSSAWVYRPLAHLVVRGLLPLPVTPPMVVLFHTLLGVFAGFAITQQWFVLAAVLYQVKTVLDNADGQLARAKNQTSEIGRYLDSEMDLVVNAAAFWGIAALTGQWWLCGLGWLVFTLIQSLDFNAEYLYQHAHDQTFRPQPDSSTENQLVLGLLRGFYYLFFWPQDQLLRSISFGRFNRICHHVSDSNLRQQARLAYWDGEMHAVVANFGLSSQMGLLGLCLVFGQPLAFVWLQLLQLAIIVWLQQRAEAKARAILAQ